MTAPALDGEASYVCLDCDALQVEATDLCPSCGGVVAARMEPTSVDDDPLIGRKLGGRFTIVARLGAGSMGAVYRARQVGMSREVALKVLKPERALDAGAQQRFEREARATSALTSPHTVTVYDFGEDDSTAQGPLLYLAMERLEGEPLSSRMRSAGRIAPKDAIKLTQQTLRSLAEAHDKGVIHRDLKPDNIFLHRIPTPHGFEEMVKVLDFGIAKILQPDLKVDSLETQAGTVFGTPRYMSPEQAQSKPLDGRSDLYSVGLILFQMVTGRHCFTDDDAVVVMARHIQSLPPRPREVAPDAGISKKLEALILRTLAKDPKRRPQTAQELHDELEAVLVEPVEPPSAEFSAAAAVLSSGSLSASAVRVSNSGASAIPSYVPVADASAEMRPSGARRSAPPTTRLTNGRRAALLVAAIAALLFAVGLGARFGRQDDAERARRQSDSADDERDTRPRGDPDRARNSGDRASGAASSTAVTVATVVDSAIGKPSTSAPAPAVATVATVAKTTKPWAPTKASAEPVASAAPPATATAEAAPAPTASVKKPKYGKFD